MEEGVRVLFHHSTQPPLHSLTLTQPPPPPSPCPLSSPLLQMIYECEGSLDCADLSGKTLLHMAALHGRGEVVRWVARKPDLQGLFGRTDRCGRRALDEVRLLLQEVESGRERVMGSEVDDDNELSGAVSADQLKDVIAALEEGSTCAEVIGGDGLVEF